jgi:Gpi18-like mannosyltransferase
LSRALSTANPFDTGSAENALSRPSPIALLIGLGALSRVLIFEVGALAFRFLPHAWVQNVPGYFVPAAGYWFQSLLGVWAHWDGYWYLSIATLGYDGRSVSTAFFPLYPMLVRAFGGTEISGILVSLLCFAGAAWLLFLLARRELGPDAAWYSLLVLMFFPSSFYFNAVYPEALVVLLSAASLYLVSLRRFGWAALIAGMASAASVDGLLLGLPLLIALWQERRPWREWLSLLLVPLGLLSYMGYLFARFGNPLTFQAAQAHWGRSFAPPWITFFQGIGDFFRNLAQFNWQHLFAGGEPAVAMSNVWNLVFAIIGIALLVVAIRRLRPALWSYALAVLIVPLFYPSTGVPLMSAPRFLLSAWPIFLAAGALLAERPRWTRAVLWTSILIGGFFVTLFATAHWVA